MHLLLTRQFLPLSTPCHFICHPSVYGVSRAIHFALFLLDGLARHLKHSSSLPPIFLSPLFLISFHQRHSLRMETNDKRYLPSIIDGNQLQSMETNPSRLSFFLFLFLLPQVAIFLPTTTIQFLLFSLVGDHLTEF